MYEDMKVKYLFINLKYRAYVTLQVFLVLAWLIAAALLFLFARSSSVWLLRHAWWICIVIGVLEVLEAVAAVAKAKSTYRAERGRP